MINVVFDKLWILDVASYGHFVIEVDSLMLSLLLLSKLVDFLSSLTKVLTFSTKPKRLLITHVTIRAQWNNCRGSIFSRFLKKSFFSVIKK